MFSLQERKLSEGTIMHLLACFLRCKFQIASLLQVRRQVCLQTHTAKSADEQEKCSICCSSHSGEWWTPDAIAESTVGWQDTIPSETPSSREHVRSEKKKEKLGHTLGVILTGSENLRNPNTPTFEEDPSSGPCAKWQGHQLGSYTRTCTKHQVRTLRIKISSSNRVLGAMLHHLLWELRKGESPIVDSGASLHMMSTSDLTPEEKETIRQSKDLSIIMTANGAIHKTAEATENVVDLNMSVCFSVQFLKETPAVPSLGKVYEENGYSYDWHPSQPSCLTKKWENNRMSNRQPHSLGCPRRGSNRAPDPSSGRPEADTCCGRPRATSGNRCTRMASTIYGRKNREIVKFDRRLSSWRGKTTASTSTFSASSSETDFEQSRKKSQFLLIFPKTRIAKCADARKLRERHAEEILTIGWTELKWPKDYMIKADHKVFNEEQESRMHHIYAVVVWDLATQWIQSYSMQSQNQLRRQRKLRTVIRPEENPRFI